MGMPLIPHVHAKYLSLFLGIQNIHSSAKLELVDLLIRLLHGTQVKYQSRKN